MSFHQDVMEGINAFTAMRSSLHESPYEQYYKYKLETEKAEKKKQDAIQKAADDAYKAQHGGQSPGTAAPTPVVTATAINPNPNTAMPGMGGSPPPDPNDPNLTGTGGTYRRGGRVTYAEDGAVLDDESLSPRERAMIEAQRSGQTMERAIDTNVGEATSPYEGPSSRFGRAVGPTVQRYLKGDPAQAERDALEQRAYELREGLFEQTTPQERQVRAQQLRDVEAKLATLSPQGGRPGAPGQQGVPTPTPAQTSPQTPPVPPPMPAEQLAPGQMTPSEAAEVERGALRPRPVPPSFPARSGLQGYPSGGPPPPVQPQQTGQATPAPPPVGGGPGVGPPGGSATLNAPASPPVPVGPGEATGPPTPLGGAPSAPMPPPQAPTGPPAPGSLGDPRRVKAFDPTADLRDPNNVGVVQPGGGVDPQQQQVVEAAKKSFNAAVSGGVHFAQFLTRQGENHAHSARDEHPLYAGVGAMPANIAQNVYREWSDKGRVDPGAALTRYMVYRYEALSATGHTAEANQMAFEVMQRLNLEAARHGGIALDFMQKGEYEAAITALQQAHAMTPDGLKLAVSKDGQTGVMLDEFTGLPTSQPFRVTPQFVLGSALGLANGRGMWNMLAIRAQQFAHGKSGGTQAADKDAEGRGLRNELTRERLKVLRGRGGGGGGRGGKKGTSMSEAEAEANARIQAIAGGRVAAPSETASQREEVDPRVQDALSGSNEEVAEREP